MVFDKNVLFHLFAARESLRNLTLSSHTLISQNRDFGIAGASGAGGFPVFAHVRSLTVRDAYAFKVDAWKSIMPRCFPALDTLRVDEHQFSFYFDDESRYYGQGRCQLMPHILAHAGDYCRHTLEVSVECKHLIDTYNSTPLVNIDPRIQIFRLHLCHLEWVPSRNSYSSQGKEVDSLVTWMNGMLTDNDHQTYKHLQWCIYEGPHLSFSEHAKKLDPPAKVVARFARPPVAWPTFRSFCHCKAA